MLGELKSGRDDTMRSGSFGGGEMGESLGDASSVDGRMRVFTCESIWGLDS